MSDEHTLPPAAPSPPDPPVPPATPEAPPPPGPFHLGPVPPSEAVEAKKEKKKKKKEKKKEGGALGSSRGVETMFRTSYRVNMDLSALADTKSNIMISINGIIISIIIASISPKIDANPWLLLPTAVLLIGCLGSMIYAVLAARPRVSSTVISLEDVRQNRANILFFGNFVHLSRDEYVEGMIELLQATDTLYVNMIRDIYALGQVLQKKFTLLRVSYTIFMFALIAGVLLFVFVLSLVAIGPVGPAAAPPPTTAPLP